MPTVFGFESTAMSTEAGQQRMQRILLPLLEKIYGEINEAAPKEISIDKDNNLRINGTSVGDWRLVSRFEAHGPMLTFQYGDNTRAVMFGTDPLDPLTCHEVDSVVEFPPWSTDVKYIYERRKMLHDSHTKPARRTPDTADGKPDPKRQTVVVNLVAGPGAGKTTCAWEIAAELKKAGLVVEYVPEVAKEYVWEGRTDLLDGTLEHQRELYEKQNHRVQRLMGKVDVIVTDSPIILNLLYLKEKNQGFEDEVMAQFRAQTNFTLFVQRGSGFEREGRIHTQEQSAQLDKDILGLLDKNGIYYGKYGYSQMRQCVKNIQTTFRKSNKDLIPPPARCGVHL